MNIPGVKYLDIFIEESEIKEKSKDLMKILRPDWPQTDIRVVVFTDGISNKLVGCHLNGDTDKQDVVLVRVYGKKTELIVNREEELRTMSVLNKAGLSKPVYAKFNNGIAYGFVPGECLNEVTVRDDYVSGLICEEMVRYHSLVPPKNADNITISTELGLFNKLTNWLSCIPDSFSHPDQQQRFQDDIPSKEVLYEELEVLRRELSGLGSPVVFCHNDLLLGNIVHNKQKGRVFFIDFEYGFYNYAAYDIANHFCEYAGINEVDYNLYPGKEYQKKWLLKYLQCKYTQEGQPTLDITDKDVETLYVQVNKFALGAHYFWGVWAIIQSCFSTIDFDYLGYAGLRLKEYFKRKEEFLALKLP